MACLKAWRSASVAGPMRLPGGRIQARSVGVGRPLASSSETRASPTPSSVMAASISSPGFGRIVCAAVLTAFWSRGVKARKACWMRLPSWPSTVSGMSSGFCVTKYTPTPLERTSRTTCSILSSSADGASLNSRCASSKKNTSPGCSGSPISGSFSYRSASSQSRNTPYRRGACISLSAARILTIPRPCASVRSRSCTSSMGSPKNCSAPCDSSRSRPRWMAPTVAADTLP
ncbi:Uncharacterised protein [Bordetella pertussis]|nr:Uncharacterised protein [Bordetella pertussis]CFL87364.1 Uncharacterised protein [Bordetella pertussis]CFL90375.1 Uncharacterised protein [Bordetella pertussis]CFM00603.1 Uncharacterised protein [Bordetella pertussis]CFM17769.1 Uncharacterised protein [Bordetella pertussis]